jgi:hypothetical protein
MPLRDHFHPPLSDQRPWEGIHSLWASTIVQRLSKRLPRRYFAIPQVHLGDQIEVDVATFELDAPFPPPEEDNGGVATAVWAPPRATQTVAVEIPIEDVFEVRVYDERRGFHLVAAIELVSNKDRPENRHAFAIKCAAYLQQQVSLVVVDVVTERHANLHAELMELLQLTAPSIDAEAMQLYAVAYRTTKENDAWRMDIWPEQLALDAPLPTLPLWLASNLAVPLELELTYEETCQVLRIR